MLTHAFQFNTNYINVWKFEDTELILLHYFSVLEDAEMSLRMAAISGYTQFFEISLAKFESKEEEENVVNAKQTGKEKIKKFLSFKLLPSLIKKIKLTSNL